MSRCFPYPPPGYEKSAALIGSIKLQKEKEKTKKEKKKEKKKERKEKSRGDGGKKEELQHEDRKRKYELSQSDNKLGGHLKTREDESAQLERSSLTEEQGPAVVQNICDSSDSTQNSSKRKKLNSAEISYSARGVGLRIRLPLLKHTDVEPPPRSIEQPCSTGRTVTVAVQWETGATGHLQLPSSSEQPCFSGRIVATHSESLAEILRGKHALAEVSRGKHTSAEAGRIRSCGCSCDSHVRRQYKKLIRDWNPPPLQVEDPESDDDWLFGKPAAASRQQQGGAGGQVAGKDIDLGDALCAWPPRACYLPDVGVYALPYVVPF